jgi:hypothetical protein
MMIIFNFVDSCQGLLLIIINKNIFIKLFNVSISFEIRF